MGYVPGFGDFLDLPANYVSWNETSSYCSQLTQRERQAGRIPAGYSYRLPSEAEWEYVARAGTSTRFFYGDDPGYTNLNQYAWHGFGGAYVYHFGGEKLPNPSGLYDIYGNVQEWCFDWFDRYPGGSVTNWSGPPFGTARVLRGGGSQEGPPWCRSANRNMTGPVSQYPQWGFRIVLSCN